MFKSRKLNAFFIISSLIVVVGIASHYLKFDASEILRGIAVIGAVYIASIAFEDGLSRNEYGVIREMIFAISDGRITADEIVKVVKELGDAFLTMNNSKTND